MLVIAKIIRSISLTVLLASNLLLTTSVVFAKQYARPVVEHLEAAERLIGNKDYEKAKEQILLALHLDPQCTDALNNLGVIYLRLHYFDKASEYFERALKIDPDLPTSLNNLAQVYYFSGKYDLAVATYKKALPFTHGSDCLLLSNLADALTAKKDYAEANDYYQQVLKINPNFAPALLGLANLSFYTESYEQAYQYAVKVLVVKPDWALAYYQLGRIESKRGNQAAALKAYLLSLNYEKNPNYARETKKLIMTLGIDPLSIEQGDLLKYKASISHTTSQSTASREQKAAVPSATKQISLEHAQSNLLCQRWEAAENELGALLKQAPDPVLFNDLGLANAGKKNYAAAESFYLKAISLSKGKCMSAYYNLGQLYRLQGNKPAAKDALQKAIILAKEERKACPLANNALALVLKQMGDNTGAMAAYKLAISQAGSDYPVFHYNYAIFLENNERVREAINEYKTYLKLAPRGFNVEQAQIRLKRLGANS